MEVRSLILFVCDSCPCTLMSTEEKDEPRRFLTTGEDANPKDVAVKSGLQKKEVG